MFQSMKNFIAIVSIVIFAVSIASAQKTNDAMAKQIKSLKADKSITLTYDEASNASKILGSISLGMPMPVSLTSTRNS